MTPVQAKELKPGTMVKRKDRFDRELWCVGRFDKLMLSQTRAMVEVNGHEQIWVIREMVEA